jgi:hypothetical protein
METASTDLNGVSNYYTYDPWGRLLLKLDQDKNILEANTYVTANNVQNFVTPTIYTTPLTGITTATAVTFQSENAYDNCTGAGLVYNWTFGDGNSAQVTYPNTVTHTYASPGTYYVNLTINSTLFGSKSAPQSSVTVAAASPASVTLTNHTVAGSIGSVTFTSSTNTYHISSYPTSIVPGTYTVSFQETGGAYNPTTGKGMTNVVFSDGSTGKCFSYSTGTNTFSWTVNSGDTLNFSIYNNNYCPY